MKERHKILIVDDAEINRSLLADMLDEEYDIIEASNGIEALAMINRHHTELSLILLDIVMPEMDGFEVLAAMNSSRWLEKIPVVIISAETSSVYIDHAYDLGASEYINRPFDEKTVKRRVHNMIVLYSKQKLLENMLAEQMYEKERANLLMVEILSHIVEFRNGESGLHVLHIRVMTETLLKALARMTDRYDITPESIELISNAATLHDIGKITIAEDILNKPGKLTPEEYEAMKKHSAAGAEMLESVSYYKTERLVQVARDICRWHHERYDGRGYPDGLVGEEIPIAAQVVSMADTYDALTSERVYKPAYTHAQALEMIKNGECGQFNPLLLKCLDEAAPYLEKELSIRSTGQRTKEDIRDTTRNLIQSGQVSNRTLALLEQERTKYQFFASMSNEIQFEYDHSTQILTLSDWGAAYLDIKAVINRPAENQDMLRIFTKKDVEDFSKRVNKATPENPIVIKNYCLNIKGEKRWCKVVARPLWLGGENEELTGIIGKITDVHEEHLELTQLKQLANQDSLTKLYNREYVQQLIQNILKQDLKEEEAYAMIIMDLDYFKHANDSYGHMFGDEVLKEVAELIRAGLGNTDVAARIGGDEFLLFIKCGLNPEEVVKKLFDTITASYHGFVIQVSMGISILGRDGSSYEEMFHKADQALYAAKKRGRNQYCYYEDSMKESLSVLSEME